MVRLACPETLPLLPDASMGSLAETLLDAAQQYHTCRRAVMEAW